MSAQHRRGPLVTEKTPMDRFENAIREVGVVAACEWFGHSHDSEFTKETARLLAERAALDITKATSAQTARVDASKEAV